VVSPKPSQPLQPEPPAVAARAAVIRRDAEAIRAECQRSAGGDWERWQRETAPYRSALKDRIDGLKPLDSKLAPWLDGKYEVLDGRGDFPLFEIKARENLVHVYDPNSLAAFRSDRPVIVARDWLRQRGIDLILVVVPKMTEVYIEHFLDTCPTDGIIAPHLRQTLLELLEADVEAVDGYSLFRAARDSDPEYFYNTADTHWAPRAMHIAAVEVAKRIARYKFGAEAMSATPVVKTSVGSYSIQGAGSTSLPGPLPRLEGWLLLNERQRRLATVAQTRSVSHVTLPDGSEPLDDPLSPVLVIGHSYVTNFREQLIKEMNLLIKTRWSAAQTTEAFGDFLREPELLAGRRVVVWVTTEQHMTHFAPLPAAITNERLGGR
jgi:SGNH hydrolase-like domain, acetyltransferase AlgX